MLGFGVATEDGKKTPFDEKEHFHFLSGALKKHQRRDSDSEDGDVEDGDDENGIKSTKGKQKRTSLKPSAKQDTSTTPGSIGNSVNLPHSEASSRAGTPSGLHPSHNMDSPHKYPPISSPARSRRGSIDDADSTLINAAKVIKTAVLHDARNIKGKDSGLKTLIWNVNSAHEAKVDFLSIYAIVSMLMMLYKLCSDWPKRSTTASKTVNVHTSSHRISIQPSTPKKKLANVSGSLIRTITATSLGPRSKPP